MGSRSMQTHGKTSIRRTRLTHSETFIYTKAKNLCMHAQDEGLAVRLRALWPMAKVHVALKTALLKIVLDFVANSKVVESLINHTCPHGSHSLTHSLTHYLYPIHTHPCTSLSSRTRHHSLARWLPQSHEPSRAHIHTYKHSICPYTPLNSNSNRNSCSYSTQPCTRNPLEGCRK